MRNLLVKLPAIRALFASLGFLIISNPLPVQAQTINHAPRHPAIAYPLQGLYHGAAYYPELWPETNVDGDIREMKKLGINVVRMGEFAWATLEPNEGQISLDFFLRVMDKLQAADIGTVFCTPTATPPIWLSYQHPERCFVDQNGDVMNHGARQHMSYDDPTVRAACARIVTAIAKAVGKHPGLVAWQIDNELRCHVAEDFNPSAIARWHEWLRQRYGSIDRLNNAWGTDIWSEHYQSFEQVPAPIRTPFAHNASLSTAWLMFSREDIAEFLDLQVNIIRQYSSAPITHNMNLGFALNFERMCKNLDFAAFDDYPPSTDWQEMVFDYDLFRAAKPGKPFYVMETSSSHNGWLMDYEPPHPPGFLTAEAVSAYGSGAAGFSYWLWRQQRTGCELPHSALLSAWGKPGLGYVSVESVEQAREQLAPLLEHSHPLPSEVAVTWSDRARAFLKVEPLGENKNLTVDYNHIIKNWHRCLMDAGISRDVRFEDASLDGLKLLITPAMPFVSGDFLKRVEPWVRNGGIWIAGPLTGTRTEEHTVPTDAGLGPLDAFGGLETVYSFPVTGTGSTGAAFGLTASLSGWCSALRPASADTKSMGEIHSDLVHGLSFITERTLGKGAVVVMGAQPDGEVGQQMMTKLVKYYAAQAGVADWYTATPGTIVCPRKTNDGHTLLIVVNLDGKGGQFELPHSADSLPSGGREPAGWIKLRPYQYGVFQ